MIWHKQKPTIEFLSSEARTNNLVGHLGMEFVEVGDDYLTMKMPVDQRTKQTFGILHGGASCALAETCGSVAANLCVDQEHRAVGMEINANHIRPMKDGWVYAKSWPYHLGRSSQIWHIEIFTEEGKLVCVSRLTLSVVNRSKI